MSLHVNAWNYHSAVTPCPTCEGTGEVWNGKGHGGNDPDSFDVDCPDCVGSPVEGLWPCKVCGFQHVVEGYDCLVCETVASIPEAALDAIEREHLQRAFAAALSAAGSAGTIPTRRAA